MKISIAAIVAACLAAPAFADFNGQTILGPLFNGDSVLGDNTNSSDDNDGFTSGDHIFDIWDGGDDVYAITWLGGNLTLRLTYDSFACDPDLFLYTPSDLNDSSIYSISGGSPDEVTLNNAAPGTYYAVIDSAAGSEGAYKLAVIPAPGAFGVMMAGGLLAARRRR